MSALPPLVNQKIVSYLGWNLETLTSYVKEDDYGMKWPEETPQYVKELHGYYIGGLDGHDSFFHMVNAIKLDLPSVQLTSNGYINHTFLRVIKECCDNRDLAIAGAASSGKTFPVACFILQDWKSAPNETLTFVCTTSLGAADDRIWGAIVKLWQSSHYKVGDYIPHKHCIAFGKFSEDASDREYSSAIKALAIEKGSEGEKAIDTTRGRKQSRVRIVFDELPEMGVNCTRACVNLESNPDFRAIYIGNPAKRNDAHGEICKPDHPEEWSSINVRIERWKTRTGYCIFMNGEWSPNFEAGLDEPIPFPYLTNRSTLDKMLIRCHGNTNSLEYFRNAIGFWPGASVIETVLTVELIKQYGAHLPTKWLGRPKIKVAGLDLGFTFGGDKCVLQIGEVGTNVDSRKVLSWLKEFTFIPEQSGVFEEAVAKWAVDICIKEEVSPANLGLDISGDGGKIMREIIRYWISINPAATEIFPISSMGKPTERIVSNVDTRKCCDVYDKRVTEYWMAVRECVLTNSIYNFPIGSDAASDLCTRVYSIVNRKLSIEPKDEFKENNKHSPDSGDAFCYMVEMARRLGIESRSPVERIRAEKRKEERRHSSLLEVGSYSSDDWGERDLLAA